MKKSINKAKSYKYKNNNYKIKSKLMTLKMPCNGIHKKNCASINAPPQKNDQR